MTIQINNASKRSQVKGLSLIEVLVTITITSIGLMGLVSLQMQAVRATTDSGNRSQAVWVFNDIINRIHANETASNRYAVLGPVTCASRPTVCSSFHTGTALVNPTAPCTGAQQAAWDRYEVACALSPTPFIGDSIKYLPSSKLTILCADDTATCDPGAPLKITLEWRARTDVEAITGAARDANSGLLTLTDVITP